MKYIINIYDGPVPRKGIAPLNADGRMHGEEKIYDYAHKYPSRNHESLIVHRWTHVASRHYTNGVDDRIYSYIEYEDSDVSGSRTIHHVRNEVRFMYREDNTCVVSLYKDNELTDRITKVNGILHGKREIYRLDYNMAGDISSYIWHETYNYVNGVLDGPVTHIARNGDIYKTNTYVNGKKHGTYRKYYRCVGGWLTRHYDHGKRCGKEVRYYNDNKTIRSTITYDNPDVYRECCYYPSGIMWLTCDIDRTTMPFTRVGTTYANDGTIEDVAHDAFKKRIKNTDLSYSYKSQTYSSIVDHPEPVIEKSIKSIIM